MNRTYFRLLIIASLVILPQIPTLRAQWVRTSGPNACSSCAFATIGNDLFAGTNDANFAAPTGAGVFRSSDNGDTWIAANTGLTNMVVYSLATSGSTLYAGTLGGVFATSDLGAHWTSILAADTVYSLLASTASGSLSLFAATPSGLLRSTNNGATWEEKDSGFVSSYADYICAMGSLLYCANYDVTGDRIFVSSDNGTSWNDAAFPESIVYTLQPIGTTLYVGSYGGLYATTDSGQSWSLPLLMNFPSAIAYSDHKLFAGTIGHGVYFSMDSGSSWTQDNIGLGNSGDLMKVRALIVNNSNLLVGNYAAGVWRRPVSEFGMTPPVIGYWRTGSTAGLTPRTYASSVMVNDKLYLMGGFPSVNIPGALGTCEVYDPVSDQWSTVATSGTDVRAGATAQYANGKIYVIAGDDTTWTEVNSTAALDPATNTWQTISTNGNYSPRDRGCSATVNGKIYLFGGTKNHKLVTGIDMFDPASNTWSSVSTTGTYTPRKSAACVAADSKIYLFGGSTGVAINTLEVFDPSTNTWTTPATTGVPSARYGATATVLNGKIYIIGGAASQSDATHTIDVFDISTNTWTTESGDGHFTNRTGASAFASQGRIYVLDGTMQDPIVASNEYLTFYGSSVSKPLPTRSTIHVSPNPTAGILTVACDAMTHIQVFDLLGHELLHTDHASGEAQIDLTSAPRGTYALRVTSHGVSLTQLVLRE